MSNEKAPTTAAQRQAKYRANLVRRHEQAVIDAYAKGYDDGKVARQNLSILRNYRPADEDGMTPDD